MLARMHLAGRDFNRQQPNLRGLAWGSSHLVVVGDHGTIATSRDGATWTCRNSGTGQNLHRVAYGNGNFVAVGSGGAIVQSQVILSLNGRKLPDSGDFELTVYGESGQSTCLQ